MISSTAFNYVAVILSGIWCIIILILYVLNKLNDDV